MKKILFGLSLISSLAYASPTGSSANETAAGQPKVIMVKPAAARPSRPSNKTTTAKPAKSKTGHKKAPKPTTKKSNNNK